MAEIYENKDMSIMCPNCKKFLTKTDKNDDREHMLKCKHCGKLIMYNAKGKYIASKNVPPRTQSSGTRFY